jgi:hypothetical protein
MFTPEGELRRDFRYLEEDSAKSPDERNAPQAISDEARTAAMDQGSSESSERQPPRTSTAASRTPTFVDLVSVLAEPVPLFLGDARLPDGGSAENLDLARFHIDLLDTLYKKTEGNLASEEASLLEELLYKLRLRYVQKRG